MRNNDDRNKLIEALSENPYINYACKKVGVPRTTFYRWMRDHSDFKDRVNKAVRIGRENAGEVIESALVKKASGGDFGAMKFYLTHNNRRYLPKDKVYLGLPADLMEFDAFNQKKPKEPPQFLSDNDEVNFLRTLHSNKPTDVIKEFKLKMKLLSDKVDQKIKLKKLMESGGEQDNDDSQE